jgi:hypothetical protein
MKSQFNLKENNIDEACKIDDGIRQNDYIKNYYTSTPVTSNIETIQCLSLSNPNLQFKDGFGFVGKDGIFVENDSFLRTNQDTMTHGRERKMLCSRLFTSVPFRGGNGSGGNPELELSIRSGIHEVHHKTCMDLHCPDTFVPLVPCLKENIQDHKHIIQQDVDMTWIRGGYPSRQFMKDVLKKERCQSS